MFRGLRMATLVVGMFMFALIGSVVAQAQDGTPSAEADIPWSWECMVRPVSLLSLLAMLGELEEAQFAPPMGSVWFDELDIGQPVAEHDLEGITATTRQLVACANARDVFRMTALLTERFQARLVLELLDGSGFEAIAGQLPLLITGVDPGQDLAAIPIREAWYAEPPDKTIYAILEPQVEGLAEQPTFLVAFAYSIDRWLIDDVRLVRDDGAVAADPLEDREIAVEPPPGVVTIEAFDIGWRYENQDTGVSDVVVTIPAGQNVIFDLQNAGSVLHNFTIDELGVDVDVPAGEAVAIQVNAQAGVYEFYCDIPGHRQAGMVGTLIVE